MEAPIENIAFFEAIGNLTVNQLMEHEVVVIVTTKVALRRNPNGPR